MAVMHVGDIAALPQGGSLRGAVEAVDAEASMSLARRRPRPRRVSLVVPTCKRPQPLPNCLRAPLAQTLPPQDWELLVVDDGHDRETRRAVAALAAQHPAHTLRYLQPTSGRGPAVARNTGWRAAAAPLVAFTDDDLLPQPDRLREGLHGMEDAPDCLAMDGRVVVPRPPGAGAEPGDHELMTRGLESGSFVTANAFVRRAALEHIRGFDERLVRAWRGDSDLEFRLERAAGGSGGGRRCDSALVLHPVRPARRGVSLREQKNVGCDALLYRKHPRLYRQRIQRRPPWDCFAIVAATLAVLPLLLAGQAKAAAAGGLALVLVLVLVLVLAFAWRRRRASSRSAAHRGERLVTPALIPFLWVYWRLRGAGRFKVGFL